MKITISFDTLLDALYSRSALRAMAASTPDGIVGFMLTSDHEIALRSVLTDAFSAACAHVGAKALVEADGLVCDTVAPTIPEAYAAALKNAVILLAESIILGASASRDESHLSLALRVLSELSTRSAVITPHPY